MLFEAVLGRYLCIETFCTAYLDVCYLLTRRPPPMPHLILEMCFVVEDLLISMSRS